MNREEVVRALQVFGANLDSPFADIKKEYKNLAQVFHPDKYEAGSDRQKWASDKLISIIAAYETLKEFYETYPDGPPEEWKFEEAPKEGNNQENFSEADSGDGYYDWQQWSESQKASESATGSKEAQWHADQHLRQSELTAADKRMNWEKLLFYGKVWAAIFLCFIWFGRLGAMEATKVMAANEHQATIEQQAYEQARQGANIDGFVWSESDLANRHREQFEQLKEKNEKRSEDMWSSGLFTTALTILILWFCLASVVKGNFEGVKNEDRTVDEN